MNDVQKQWVTAAKKVIEFRAMRKHYQHLEEQAMQEVKQLANYKNYTAAGMSLTFTTRKGPVNYKLIPELHKVNLELYRGPEVTLAKLDFDNDTLINNIELINKLT